ncbi:MAG: hypothetical protein KIS73_13585 [Enhydrobacter sp.]|nr:hypothetical protein [Enhydrobacter sp.]
MARNELPDPLATPPAEFNPEWARFCVDYAATRKRRPLFESVSTLVAVFSSVLALVVSAVNAYYLKEDRAEQSRKEALAGQVSLAKLYFDRLPGTESCASRTDKQLFVKTAVTIAGFSYDDLTKAYFADARMTTIKIEDDKRALQSLAIVLFLDIYNQIRSCDDAALPASATRGGIVRVETPSVGTTYDLRQQISLPPPTPTSVKPTVYIQFQKGDAVAARRAAELQANLQSAGYKAPGTEGVNNVPKGDQIRIYKTTDESAAKELKTQPFLADAQIVDLSKAYPKLPPGIVEIWLGS